MTQSSSQDTHSRKAGGHDNRPDLLATTGTGTRSTIVRHHPIIRTPQIRCDADQTVFRIHKGAKTFDLCPAKNVLVTGGMDRVLRLWNPYLPARPVARLRGHNAPVFLVKIAMEDDRLFSISADKTVLVSRFENQNKKKQTKATTKILFSTRTISYCYRERSSFFHWSICFLFARCSENELSFERRKRHRSIRHNV